MTRASRLQLDALVCDLDGVLYRGSAAIPGAADAIAEIRAAGTRVLFATNNATKTLDQYVERLGRFGVDVDPQDLVTSAVVTAEEIEQRELSRATVFLVGGDGIAEALRHAGMSLIDGMSARAADVVVISGTSNFTYDDVKTAAFAVRNGARFLATNDDATFPAADGLWPGAGSLLAAVEKAGGSHAEVMGKPYPPMMKAIARRLPSTARIGVVGDQPDTDLAGARSMGWTTVLVLSGVTDASTARMLKPAPDLIVPSLVELPQALSDP